MTSNLIKELNSSQQSISNASKNTKVDKNIITQFAKINRLDLKQIKAFLKYKPTTNGNDVMKEFGVKGPEIAQKIKEIEAKKFKQTI